ncbi:MAG: hypothetical protein ACYDD5_00135 [Sulfuricurvum sp.]
MANTRNFTHTSNFFFGTSLFGEETLYNIQTCNLPGMQFNHIQVSHRAVQGFLQGDTIDYNDLNIDIIVDENLEVWKDIVTSMQIMREPKTSTAEKIERMSWLEIHDDNSNRVLKIELSGSMIESIGDLDFTTTGDDEVILLPVTIKYDFYKIV